MSGDHNMYGDGTVYRGERSADSGAAIQRYKIGYHSDEWGQRSSTPSGIPDASGSWVRYADHVTALTAGQATAAQAESVPAVEREQERIAFKDAHRHLELYEVPDAWGRPMFKHSHVEASWLGWIARASRGQAPADAAPSAGAVAGPDDIDAIALTRYKVVRSHDSMFHCFAVVAGDGKQQLYLGRETECQNMTRKFAGAFLDGAFYQSQIAAAPTPAAQAADSVQEDAARYRWLREGNDATHGAAWHVAVNLYGCEWDAAIDAAMNKGATT